MPLHVKKKIDNTEIILTIASPKTGFLEENGFNNIILVYAHCDGKYLSNAEVIKHFPFTTDIIDLNGCYADTGENINAKQYRDWDVIQKIINNLYDKNVKLFKKMSDTLRIPYEEIDFIANEINFHNKKEIWESYYDNALIPQWKDELIVGLKAIENYVQNTKAISLS